MRPVRSEEQELSSLRTLEYIDVQYYAEPAVQIKNKL